jgi:hypothetical protein
MQGKHIERIKVAALFAAWIGIWGTWIPAEAASLRQNAVDLAEWATFLPEVQSGALNTIPDILRLSIALITIIAAWKSRDIGNIWVCWAVRFACILPGLLLLPPYPFVLQLWNSESYGLRFVISGIALVGVGLSVFANTVPERMLRIARMILPLAAIGMALYAYAALCGPFAIRFGLRINPGWGITIFVIGAILSVLLEGSSIFFPHNQPPESKTGQAV